MQLFSVHVKFTLLVGLFLLSVIGCDQQPSVNKSVGSKAGQITTERLLNIDAEPGAWLTGGRDYQQSYSSPLKSINKENVQQLGFAWQYDLDTTQGFESTPTVVDGVMFSSGPKGAVYALDAKTGKPRWNFEPEIDPAIMRKACCGPVNRGVAVWQGSVYVASLDGYLYALNADTGAVNWKVDTITERDRGYSITGAPYIANEVVVIGNSGAEFDARGYVTAYDVKTGEQRWRFFTVPGNPDNGFEHPEMETAAKTWDPNSLWQLGLGGTVWDSMAYDPILNLLYIGTGNAVPYPRKLRSPSGGDNLFLSSILAINPDNGQLVWYYQTTPGDQWDYTATQKMILADLDIEGQKRQVLMQAPKNGFFYVLDRKTGELLSAEPYVQVTWASHIDKATGKPVETGQGDYSGTPKMVFPSIYGGHSWQPMAFNIETGLVYIPTIEDAAIFSMPEKPFAYQKGGLNHGVEIFSPIRGPYGLDADGANRLPPIETLAEGQPDYTMRGFLRAWDPVKQRLVWEVETSGQWAGNFFATWSGGVMTTAGGLVFQGRLTGELVILDAKSGEVLHSIDVGTDMMAAPMTYSINGEQYVAIMAGNPKPIFAPNSASDKYGSRGRIVAFKLGGGEVPKRAEVQRDDNADFAMPPITQRGTVAQSATGAALFQRNCAQCHTNKGDGRVPDLRKMSQSTHEEFMDIVLKGTRVDRGMGNFSDLLSSVEAEAIHTYLIDLSWKAYSNQAEHIPVH